jgi:hypothetical protein
MEQQFFSCPDLVGGIGGEKDQEHFQVYDVFLNGLC